LKRTLFQHLVSLSGHAYAVAGDLGISESSLSRHASGILRTPRVLRKAAEYFSKRLNVACDPHALTEEVDPATLVAVVLYRRSNALLPKPGDVK